MLIANHGAFSTSGETYFGIAFARPSWPEAKVNHAVVVKLSDGSKTVFYSGSLPMTDMAWHHVAVVLRAKNLAPEIYVDGQRDLPVRKTQSWGSGDPSRFMDADPVYLGDNNVGSHYFTGSLDELKIYSRALSQLEISQLAAPPVASRVISGRAPNGTTVAVVSGDWLAKADITDGTFLFSGVPLGIAHICCSQQGFASAEPEERILTSSSPVIGDVEFGPLAPLVSQTRSCSAWLPDYDIDKGIGNARTHRAMLTAILISAHRLQMGGTIGDLEAAPEKIAELLSVCRDGPNPVAVFGSIGTQRDSSEPVHQMLKEPGGIERHISDVVRIALQNGYDGIDVDYENIDLSYKAQFTQFVRKLAKTLHMYGKALSLTLQPPAWSLGQDYRAILAAESYSEAPPDEIRVMCYDNLPSGASLTMNPRGPYHSEPEWVDTMIKTAIDLGVPRGKLIVGLPLYGHKTTVNGPSPIWWDEVQDCLRASGANPVMMAPVWVPHFDSGIFNVGIVWYEDGKSIHRKLDTVLRHDIAGVCFWRLGREDPDVWTLAVDHMQRGVMAGILGDMDLSGELDLPDLLPLLRKIGGAYDAYADIDQDGDVDLDDAKILAQYILRMIPFLPQGGT